MNETNFISFDKMVDCAIDLLEKDLSKILSIYINIYDADAYCEFHLTNAVLIINILHDGYLDNKKHKKIHDLIYDGNEGIAATALNSRNYKRYLEMKAFW